MGGDTTIGAGSTIGGNVFVTQSVPRRSLVKVQELSLKILDKDAHKRDVQLDWVI